MRTFLKERPAKRISFSVSAATPSYKSLSLTLWADLASSSHVKSVQAIHRGLLSKLERGKKPPYWIQISGGAAVVSTEVANRNWEPGTGSDNVWDDLDGIAAIKSIIRSNPTRAVDNYMMSVAQSSSYIKTAVIYPPIIYGSGRGLVNQRSVQIPDLVEASLKRRRAFTLGPGVNRWGNIHIRDLSEMILRLIEKAVERHTDNNVWGQDGIYLTGVGELVRLVSTPDLTSKLSLDS